MSSGNDRNSKADGSGPPPFVVDVSADGMFSCGGEADGRQDAAQSDVGFDDGGERIARLFKRRLLRVAARERLRKRNRSEPGSR